MLLVFSFAMLAAQAAPPGCAVFEKGWDLAGADYYVGEEQCWSRVEVCVREKPFLVEARVSHSPFPGHPHPPAAVVSWAYECPDPVDMSVCARPFRAPSLPQLRSHKSDVDLWKIFQRRENARRCSPPRRAPTTTTTTTLPLSPPDAPGKPDMGVVAHTTDSC